jgi:2-methylcitrate dehydratase PrpD
MTDYLHDLARFASDVHHDKLPASTIAAAKLVLLDTLGAMLAGSREPENVKLARFAAQRAPGGSATLIGHGAKSDAFWAALSNATAGVALEVDEGNRLGGGHPSIHTLPGALAVAEERDLDGRRLLEALIAGYEVGSRIGGATTARSNVHSHGTWGTIGTAVAVARLADLSADAMREVINLSASMTPANTWTPALVGATIRNLYPGRSAFQGILAVELQRCGFTGLQDAPSDVYGTILADAFDPAAAVAGLDEVGAAGTYRIEQNYFKFHACCRYNHFALDAVQRLRAQHGVKAADVARIEVATLPFAVRMADPLPATPLAARFSIPYAVAAAMVLGRSDPSAFQPSAMADERIRDLARRVEITVDPEASPRRVDRPTANVRIVLRDGRALAATTTAARGDAANPVPPAEVEEKFLALASPALGDATRVRAVAEAVHSVDTVRVRHVTELLAAR